jgi:hypothetical protein
MAAFAKSWRRLRQPPAASLEIMRVSGLAALGVLGLCFVAGYFLAGLLGSSARHTSPLAQICARVDYVNSLQENLHGQAASDEVGAELKELVEQCRMALRDHADEND